MTTPTKSIRLPLLLGLSLLASSFAALADFKQDYGRGKKAYEDGDYRDAVSSLESAIAENAEEQERVRIYGMRFEPYLPHYYLGAARFELGDCQGAVAAWQESERQGLIRSMPEYAELQRKISQCAADVVDIDAIAQEARSNIDSLEAAAQRYAALADESLLEAEWDARWKPALDEARQTVASLRGKLDAAVGANQADVIESIAQDAAGATRSLESTQELAASQVETLRANRAAAAQERRTEARRSLLQAIAGARAVEFRPGSDEMATIQAELGSRLSSAETLSQNDSASPEALRSEAQSINALARRYAVAEQDFERQQSLAQEAERRVPPASLKTIAEAYFAGDFRGAVQQADPDTVDEARAKVQVLLFRAAARHRLYVLSGESDSALRTGMLDDIRTIKRLDGDFSPYISAFSPRFLELFRETS